MTDVYVIAKEWLIAAEGAAKQNEFEVSIDPDELVEICTALINLIEKQEQDDE